MKRLKDKGDWGSFYSDAFVANIDTTRSGDDSLVYSTYPGSKSDDVGKGIAVNGSGEAYVTGYTKGCDFPILNEFQGYQDCGYRTCNAFTAMIDKIIYLAPIL
jgi:hypothetical protein